MDHLPKVRLPTNRLPNVPYYEDRRFSYKDPFDGFDKRVKAKLDLIPEDGPERRRAYSSFVQSWLYFGLLKAFFGIWKLPVHKHDFIYERSIGSFVTSQFLQEYLVAVVCYEYKRHQGSRALKTNVTIVTPGEWDHVAGMRAGKRISKAYNILQRHHDALKNQIRMDDVEPSVWDSVTILGATLSRAKDLIFRSTHGHFDFTLKDRRHHFINYDDFQLRSIPDFRYRPHWCPNERNVIAELIDGRLPEVAFLSQMKILRSDVSHEKCTEDECVAFQIDNQADYPTRHAKEGCTCDLVGFEEGDIESNYGDDEYPQTPMSRSDAFEMEPMSLETTSPKASEMGYFPDVALIDGGLDQTEEKALEDLNTPEVSDDDQSSTSESPSDESMEPENIELESLSLETVHSKEIIVEEQSLETASTISSETTPLLAKVLSDGTPPLESLTSASTQTLESVASGSPQPEGKESRLRKLRSRAMQMSPVQSFQSSVAHSREFWSKRVPAVTFQDGKIKRISVPLKKAAATSHISVPWRDWNLVAISHVWADGLGNPHENKLPRCQLEKLQNCVNDLYGRRHRPVPFWIDTLMIPKYSTTPCSSMEKRDRDNARNSAIENMEWVYKGASKVLVLDNGLQSTTAGDMEPEEIGARLMACSWSRRLWTLQEGCFKSRTEFQFHDRTFKWTALHDDVLKIHKLSDWRSRSKLSKSHPVRKAQNLSWLRISPEYTLSLLTGTAVWQYKSPYLMAITMIDKRLFKITNPVWYSVFTFLEEMTVDWSGGLNGEALARCMRGMYYRNISKPIDEPLVLSSMLSARAGSATRLSRESTRPEDRYKVLFKKLRYLPREILFVDQPRYQEDGCRWIPKSLLRVNAVGSVNKVPVERRTNFEQWMIMSANPWKWYKLGYMCDQEEDGLATGLFGLRIQPIPTALTAPFTLEFPDMTPWEALKMGFGTKLSTSPKRLGKKYTVHLRRPGGGTEELTSAQEAQWVLLLDKTSSTRPSSIKALLVAVKEMYSHRPGGVTRFESLAVLRRVDVEEEEQANELPKVEVQWSAVPNQMAAKWVVG